MSSKARTKKKTVTVATVIAYENPKEGIALVRKHGVQDPIRNHNDLEYYLSKVYDDTDDKSEIEKEFAAIHPHAKFLMRVLSPSKPIVETSDLEPVRAPMKEDILTDSRPTAGYDRYSNFNSQDQPVNQPSRHSGMSTGETLAIVTIAIVGIMAIYSMHHHNNNLLKWLK